MQLLNPTLRQRDRIAGVKTVPGTIIKLLSVPSKMPGFSWGLPAGPACPYMHLGKGAICGEVGGPMHCYASRGHYIMKNIKVATSARFQWVRDCLKTDEGTREFIDTMVDAITFMTEFTGEYFFRIHDSGDFFSAAYTRAWIEVVKSCPKVSFWAPTRSYQEKNPWRHVLVELAALPNMALRPSALYFEDEPPMIEGYAAGSTAKRQGFDCPAPLQDHQCGSCRRCWTDKETPIIYNRH